MHDGRGSEGIRRVFVGHGTQAGNPMGVARREVTVAGNRSRGSRRVIASFIELGVEVAEVHSPLAGAPTRVGASAAESRVELEVPVRTRHVGGRNRRGCHRGTNAAHVADACDNAQQKVESSSPERQPTASMNLHL